MLHVHWALTKLTSFWESITWDEIGKPWTADKSQPSGGKVCFKLSSWVLLFSKGISATLRTGKRNNFPKMLRVESGTTGAANFVWQEEIFFCFSKVRESLWFKLRLRHGQHSAAISYMYIFWTSNQLYEVIEIFVNSLTFLVELNLSVFIHSGFYPYQT